MGEGEKEGEQVREGRRKSERERERERCNNRPSVRLRLEETAIRCFRPSVRLSVWQFHIHERTHKRVSADTIFHRSPSRAARTDRRRPSAAKSASLFRNVTLSLLNSLSFSHNPPVLSTSFIIPQTRSTFIPFSGKLVGATWPRGHVR